MTAQAPAPVVFESKYPNYTFGNSSKASERLEFVNGVASTRNQALIAAARADSEFGPGLSFWEKAPPKPAAETDEAKSEQGRKAR